MVQTPVDRPVGSPKPEGWLYAGLSGAAIVALIAAGLLVDWNTDLVPYDPPPFIPYEPAVPQSSETVAPAPAAALEPTSVTQEPLPKRLADAFEAATGHRSAYGVTKEGYVTTFRPVKIIQLPFGPVLLTEEDTKDGCHACTGAVGVYYLSEKAGRFKVKGRWPRAVEGWAWGLPPTDWETTNRFTAYPAVYATGGFTAQGIHTSGATITELRPNGPATSDVIGYYYDDSGAREEGDRTCIVRGRIANVRKDRSFDVIASGSVKGLDHYVKRNGRFVPRMRIEWNMPCGFSDDR